MKFKIKEVWAFVGVDPDDGDEGIIGANIGPNGSWMPFVAADENRVRSLKAIVDQIVREDQVMVRLVRFTVREDIETFSPHSIQ